MTNGTSIGERPTRASIDPDERAAWLALALVPGLGARRIATLIQHFGSAAAVLAVPPAALGEVLQVGAPLVRRIQAVRADAIASLVGRAEALDQRVLVPSDADFPARLRSIPDPPPVLFARGSLDVFSVRAVAIVGSRDHTRYGAETASRLAEVAAAAGIVVVSGMARGLDAVAQGAAVRAGGRSVGVLGTGVDQVYPVQNRELFAQVVEHGALLSEHPPGDRGHRGAFPRRNRLISGLADALLVVEAAEGSGTLITVNCALEQGRDVLAVPGPITSPTSRGTNRLLRDGATPILDPDDLLVALGLDGRALTTTPVTPPCSLSPEEARVFDVLSAEPMQLDDLALALGLPIGTLLGTLLGLELGGLVEQLSGSVFRRR